jgi:hypothetical protein
MRQTNAPSSPEIRRGFVFRSALDVPDEIRSRFPVFISEGGAELRIDGEGESQRIRGHGAVFDAIADFGWRRETVRRGAFAKTITEGDARGLFNHNVDWLLGRRRAGTMELAEDTVGLAYAIRPPATDLIRELVIEPLKRGDLNGSSFSFQAVKERETQAEDEESSLREVLEVRLFDVGPVTFPAYEATDADFRSWIGTAKSVDELALVAGLRGRGLTGPESRALLSRAMGLLDAEPDQRSTPRPDMSLRLRIRAAELEA